MDPEKPRVLVAEDDGFLRDLTGIVLRRQGFEVLPARDGEEAVEIALAQHPSLMLLDVNMPRLDGYGVARRLRGEPGFEHTPIIFLTAHAEDHDREVGYAAGATSYVTKPFDNRELVDRIREALGLPPSPPSVV